LPSHSKAAGQLATFPLLLAPFLSSLCLHIQGQLANWSLPSPLGSFWLFFKEPLDNWRLPTLLCSFLLVFYSRINRMIDHCSSSFPPLTFPCKANWPIGDFLLLLVPLWSQKQLLLALHSSLDFLLIIQQPPSIYNEVSSYWEKCSATS